MNLIQIENRAGKVKIDGSIHEGTMEQLIDRMATLYGDDAVRNELKIGETVAVASDALKSLEIEINSPGGSIKQGYRAYKTIIELRERGVYVTARITKLAASMGSILAVAADKVIIESKAKMMIHEASTMAWGNAEEMKKTTEMLDSVSNELAAIYSAKTGKPVPEVRNLMRKETWMTAEQAVAMGFADEVYTADKSAEKPKTKLDRILDGEETNSEFDIRPELPKSTGMSLLSKLFPGNDEAAKIEAAITENDSLRADLEAAQARITELTGLSEANATLQNEVNALTESKNALEASIVELKASLEAKAEEVEAAKESAGKEATEILAAIGQDEPLALTESAPPVDHLEAMKTMEPGQKRAYWKANKEAIHAQLNQR